MTTRVGVGIIGAGFAARIHARSFTRLRDLGVELVAVAAVPGDHARSFAEEFDIPHHSDDYRQVLDRTDVDLVDLCVPNDLHHTFAIAAAEAGKHIVCEKPLTGFFGPPEGTPRAQMLEGAPRNADLMLEGAHRHGVKLMYAENWLYSPAVRWIAGLIAASGGKILEIKAEEAHSGSHASYAKRWVHSGGGALMRLGPHPVGTALWLKAQEEMRSGGRPIRPISVIAEVGDLSKIPGVSDGEHSCLVADWQDVENWALVILTFTDGSRGVLLASDIALGGMMDTLEVKLSNAHLKCNISHSNLVQVYAPDESVFQDAYIQEKLETKAGWSHRSIEEEWMLGYPQEIRHFVECVIYDREPLADAHLGRQVVEVIYAAYQSAEEGRRITLARP